MVFVTGLSGAGKTTALKSFEDIGYFCIDNLPVPLIENFLELLEDAKKERKVAIGVDVRDREHIQLLPEVIKNISSRKDVKLIFLEADTNSLIKRFRETRRRHPIESESITRSIEIEVEMLKELRDIADYVIDTSYMNSYDLRRYIIDTFSGDATSMTITIITFGFKKGIPPFIDLVFDVRFLPNPYYVEELRDLTGLDDAVKEFIFKDSAFDSFMNKLTDLLSFVIPLYRKDGRNYLNIGIGCTGGVHRSVSVAERLGEFLASQGYKVDIFHRELNIIYCSFKGSLKYAEGKDRS